MPRTRRIQTRPSTTRGVDLAGSTIARIDPNTRVTADMVFSPTVLNTYRIRGDKVLTGDFPEHELARNIEMYDSDWNLVPINGASLNRFAGVRRGNTLLRETPDLTEMTVMPVDENSRAADLFFPYEENPNYRRIIDQQTSDNTDGVAIPIPVEPTLNTSNREAILNQIAQQEYITPNVEASHNSIEQSPTINTEYIPSNVSRSSDYYRFEDFFNDDGTLKTPNDLTQLYSILLPKITQLQRSGYNNNAKNTESKELGFTTEAPYNFNRFIIDRARQKGLKTLLGLPIVETQDEFNQRLLAKAKERKLTELLNLPLTLEEDPNQLNPAIINEAKRLGLKDLLGLPITGTTNGYLTKYPSRSDWRNVLSQQDYKNLPWEIVRHIYLGENFDRDIPETMNQIYREKVQQLHSQAEPDSLTQEDIDAVKTLTDDDFLKIKAKYHLPNEIQVNPYSKPLPLTKKVLENILKKQPGFFDTINQYLNSTDSMIYMNSFVTDALRRVLAEDNYSSASERFLMSKAIRKANGGENYGSKPGQLTFLWGKEGEDFITKRGIDANSASYPRLNDMGYSYNGMGINKVYSSDELARKIHQRINTLYNTNKKDIQNKLEKGLITNTEATAALEKLDNDILKLREQVGWDNNTHKSKRDPQSNFFKATSISELPTSLQDLAREVYQKDISDKLYNIMENYRRAIALSGADIRETADENGKMTGIDPSTNRRWVSLPYFPSGNTWKLNSRSFLDLPIKRNSTFIEDPALIDYFYDMKRLPPIILFNKKGGILTRK